MQEKILDMLMKEEEITWQSIIYDLIKKEEMDPWNVDISKLSQKYLETIRTLKEMNFFVSGKVILAASLLLKIKSNKLLNENIASFDNYLFQPEEIEQLEDFEDFDTQERLVKPKLTIKTPLARKRKVSINDLVSALEKALEVEKRRKFRYLRASDPEVEIKIPEKKIDIGQKIKDIYRTITEFFSSNKTKLTFTNLVPSDSKEDKITTFLPLLHLENDNKVNLKQEEHFGEIEIFLNK